MTGYLTTRECSDYLSLLVHASGHVFYHHPDLHKEVQLMTKPLIILPSMQIAELEACIAEKDSALAKKDSQLMADKTALAEKDSILAEKDSEIAFLRAKLAALSTT